jgi:hypothetical protein
LCWIGFVGRDGRRRRRRGGGWTRWFRHGGPLGLLACGALSRLALSRLALSRLARRDLVLGGNLGAAEEAAGFVELDGGVARAAAVQESLRVADEQMLRLGPLALPAADGTDAAPLA